MSAERGGFDLVVGNPPWIRVAWKEESILASLDPRVLFDSMSATSIAKNRSEILGENAAVYLAEYEQTEAVKALLGALGNYPLLQRGKPNLYKCFIERSWKLLRTGGLLGLIHQDGIFDDPSGGSLRRALYPRLRHAYRFKNELLLFSDVHHLRPYCLTISQAEMQEPSFSTIGNLFHPRTIDESWKHSGEGIVPGIKTAHGAFEISGHRQRLVRVEEKELALFARLFDGDHAPSAEARLPIVHSREALEVLTKLAAHDGRLGDLSEDVFGALMWYETKAQEDGTIRRESRPASVPEEWIVSGPHIYVGNPFNKSPRENCRHNNDYEVVDLENMSDSFLPRSVFVPAISQSEYVTRMPRFKGQPVASYYRHIHRGMVAITGERTLVSALLPPGPGHLHTMVSFAFSDLRKLAACSGFWCALPVDYLVRAKGAGHLPPEQSRQLPIPTKLSLSRSFAARALRLNCLTAEYSALWGEIWPWCGTDAEWTRIDPRLPIAIGSDSAWERNNALRTAFSRRLALVELDALAALELGITSDELSTVYRTQFPILRSYEDSTYYDSGGRIAFTTNRGLPGVGLTRADFEAWQAALDAGNPPPDDFDTLGLIPPFDRCDREEDMRRAY